MILDPDTWVVKVDHSLNEQHRLAVSLNTTDIPRLLIRNPLPPPLPLGPQIEFDNVVEHFGMPAGMEQSRCGFTLSSRSAVTASPSRGALPAESHRPTIAPQA